ncbi:hydroxycarboxylic acid receptor 3 [Hoplias malabaricus]|uniref:hydroxycarboxylic acid receptor 3 n=1 Tax=Hoplias malabaricus TaxID=27720 RepID=UPI00346357EB
MSSNNTDTHCGLQVQNLVASILPTVLIIELLLGLPGNLLALWVFCRHLKSWKPNVVFLFNLVLADFLLLVSLPFRIHYLMQLENWVFGNAWCRINLFMLAVNRSASIGFMTTVGVDRYFKVVHPHHKVNFISSLQAAGIACFIWIVVISLRLPLLTCDLLIKQDNISFCRSFNPYKNPEPEILLHYIMYLGEFFLCLIILFFCSFRIFYILHHRHLDKKKKSRQAIRIVIVIIAVFIVCFCPGVATGLNGLYLKTLEEKYCEEFRLNGQLFVLALGFTYLNSVLDPIIYGFCSSMFRDAVKSAINQLGLVQLELSHSGRTLSGSGNENRGDSGRNIT